MKNMKLKNYDQEEGCYIKDGNVATDFILMVKKVVLKKEGICKYKFYVNTKDGRSYMKIVSMQQLKRHCFLQDLPLSMEEADEFCKQLYLSLSEKILQRMRSNIKRGKTGCRK